MVLEENRRVQTRGNELAMELPDKGNRFERCTNSDGLVEFLGELHVGLLNRGVVAEIENCCPPGRRCRREEERGNK